MDIFKLAALGVTAALCALILKRGAPELSVALVLGAGVVLLGEAVTALTGIRALADSLSQTTGLSRELWAPVWKTVGIGVVTRLAVAICRDAGEGGVAAFLETAGACVALFAALPLVETVFDTLGGLL